jgi:hypothetical protein
MADFNGDGNPDIVISGSGFGVTGATTRGVTVLLGNGDGTFRPSPFTIDLGDVSNRLVLATLVVGDFNGDGKLDVRVTKPDGEVITLLGNGDGTFTPQ